MPQILTDALIAEALSSPQRSGRLELADELEPGLRLRAGKRMARWSLLAPDPLGRDVDVGLGDWPAVSVSRARETAGAIRRRGGDASGLRVRDLLERYADRHLSQLRRGPATYRTLRRGLESLLERQVEALTRRDVSQAIFHLAADAPVHANRALAYAKGLFSWSVAHGYMDANPAALIRPPSRERSRERTPSLPELAVIWEAAGLLQYPFAHAVRFLIVTAARRDEVGAMRTDELDLPEGADVGCWTIPATRSKNDRPIRVPLSRRARHVIEQALDARLRPESPYVFTTNGERPISGWSKAKGRLDQLIARTDPDLPAWRVHDFRRSFATAASDILHIAPEVADRCLNHAGSSTTSTIARVYARNELFDQRKEALDRWGDLIDEELMKARGAAIA
jgi:integrase